jgi:hypothetical protein
MNKTSLCFLLIWNVCYFKILRNRKQIFLSFREYTDFVLQQRFLLPKFLQYFKVQFPAKHLIPS